VSGINVTPLIDVLLVLLIIFMVIVPVTPHGLGALVPQPPKPDRPHPGPDDTIVIQVLGANAAPTYKINEFSLPISSLEPKLREIFASRQEKVMFVKGDAGMDYAQIAEVIDLGHQAGVKSIGLITSGVAASR
jgi:biopolymer transport protein ExbD/biopolymer transport protein TolR